jgi:hypothetical protein
LLLLLLTLVTGSCLRLNITDVSICFPHIGQYIDTVYVNENPTTQVPFATILQQYCDLFVAEFNYRKWYWAFACGLAFPRCSPSTGLPLLLCPTGPDGCDSKLPPWICTSQLPVAKEGDPCTPIGKQYSQL